jgi:hypothetical protein
MERIFSLIAKINSLLLLLLLLAGGISVSWFLWSNNQWQRRGAIELQADGSSSSKSVLLRFEGIQKVRGSDTQMLLLSAEDRSEKFSCGGYNSKTRNVLFLSGAEKNTHWLFPSQSHLILVVDQLGEGDDSENKVPTKALYFEFITKDSNGDGRITSQDQSTVGLSKPDGAGFVEVLTEVTRVLSHEILDDKVLSIVFQSGQSIRHATFSLGSLAKISEAEVVKVPTEI